MSTSSMISPVGSLPGGSRSIAPRAMIRSAPRSTVVAPMPKPRVAGSQYRRSRIILSLRRSLWPSNAMLSGEQHLTSGKVLKYRGTRQPFHPDDFRDEHLEHENLVSANDGGLQSSISVRHDPSSTGRLSPSNASLQYSARRSRPIHSSLSAATGR